MSEIVSNKKNSAELITLDTTMKDYLSNKSQDDMGTLEVGKIIEGVVIQITDTDVFVNTGHKAEGQVPVEEFPETPKIGDTVSVMILHNDIRNGGVQVSYKRAQEKNFWKILRDAFTNKEPISGTITKKINGGFEVTLQSSVTAFLPMSKVDIERIQNPDKYIHLESEFLIERLYKNKKKDILLSRRGWLEKQREQKTTEFFEKHEVGDVVEGIVKNFVAFGVFVDLGGFDGLLHLHETMWGHHPRPKSILKKGQTIKVKIIDIDSDSEKICLSMKALTKSPWLSFEERYTRNQRLTATVTKITDFGLFVELEPSIEGLVHYTEINWSRTPTTFSDQFSVGQSVEVVIIDYNLESERISLSIKRTLDDPWYDAVEKFSVGAVLKAEIAKISQHGMFVRLDECFDAFIPNEELSWTDRGKPTQGAYEVGQEIEFVIIELNSIQRRIKASIKKLSEDPWNLFAQEYGVGDAIECSVINHNQHGLIVSAPYSLEGFIHRSQLSNEPINDQDLFSKYPTGTTLKAVIKEFLPARYRLSLSVRTHIEMSEASSIEKYLEDDSDSSTIRLGDYMK